MPRSSRWSQPSQANPFSSTDLLVTLLCPACPPAVEALPLGAAGSMLLLCVYSSETRMQSAAWSWCSVPLWQHTQQCHSILLSAWLLSHLSQGPCEYTEAWAKADKYGALAQNSLHSFPRCLGKGLEDAGNVTGLQAQCHQGKEFYSKECVSE